MTLLVTLLLVLTSTILVWHLTKLKKFVILHLLLLLASPWLLTLLIARPRLKESPAVQPRFLQISENFSLLTSAEFLFSSGDKRFLYGTRDHGVFLLSFLPLMALGTYHSLVVKKSSFKLALWWLLGGLTVGGVGSNVAGLPTSLWFLPALSVLATIGTQKSLNLLGAKNTTPVTKRLIILNFFWLGYESIRLYQVIIFHQPFILK